MYSAESKVRNGTKGGPAPKKIWILLEGGKRRKEGKK